MKISERMVEFLAVDRDTVFWDTELSVIRLRGRSGNAKSEKPLNQVFASCSVKGLEYSQMYAILHQ